MNKGKIKELKEIKESVWLKMPVEIANLLSNTGPLQPAGKIIYAECDARILHEFLWDVRMMLYEKDTNYNCAKQFTMVLLKYFQKKFSGLYFLKSVANVIKLVMEGINECKESTEFLEFVDEFILYIGRISMWLDLLIPWHYLNQTFKKHARLRSRNHY